MELIFDHEKLRSDELHKKVSTKNNFLPLKPLKNLKIKTKKHIEPDLFPTKKPESRKKTRSLFSSKIKHNSPDIIKFLSDITQTEATENSLIQKFDSKTNKNLTPNRYFIGSSKTSHLYKRIKKKSVPIFSQNSPEILAPSIILKDPQSKNSNSLIAYIPTVSYITDKEENRETQFSRLKLAEKNSPPTFSKSKITIRKT